MAFKCFPTLVFRVVYSQSFVYLLSACVWLTLALVIRTQFITVRRQSNLCKPYDPPLGLEISASAEEAREVDAVELQSFAESERPSFLGLCCIIVTYARRLLISLIRALRKAFEQLARLLVQLALIVDVRWMIDGLRYRQWQFINRLSDVIASPGATRSRFVSWTLDVAADIILHASQGRHVAECDRGSRGNTAAISAAVYDSEVPTGRWQGALAPRRPPAKPSVDSGTQKFCFGYMVFVTCVVLTQPFFVQVTVCTLYCLLVHLLDTTAVTPPDTSESSDVVDRDMSSRVAAVMCANSRSSGHHMQPVWARSVAVVACAEDKVVKTSLVDWLMRILVAHMIKDPVSRRYCSVTTGAVAALNVIRYPQTVIVIFVWFALHETATCYVIVGFLKELSFSALSKVSFRNECTSCLCAGKMATDDSPIHCLQEAGNRAPSTDLQTQLTGRDASHDQCPDWCITLSRGGFGNSVRHRHGTASWSLFDDKIITAYICCSCE
jgi:hypothetical protein